MVSINYGAYPSAPDLSGFERGLAGLGDIVAERRTKKVLDQFADSLYGGQGGGEEMSLASLAPRETSAVRTAAPPIDYASQRVAQAHAASGGGPQAGAIEAYIRHAAKQRGIDPEVAVKVAKSEGGVSDPTRQSDVVKDGVREQSYGPFQLYMNGGLGNEAMAAGIDPRKDWQRGIDFALDKAKEGGWGPWYGAAKAGIGERDGIGGPQALAEPTGASQGVQMAQSDPAGSGGGLLPPREVMQQLLRNRETRPLGIAIAREAQKLRGGDQEAELRLEKLRLEVDKLRNPQPGQQNLPTSIQEFERAQADPAFAEFIKTGKGRDSSLTAGDRQAIRDAEDSAMSSTNTIDMLRSVLAPGEGGQSLNDRAGYGALAGSQAWAARNDPTGLFDDAKGEATTELQNVVLNQALSSLKSIFGAAPTEGERKILVDLQASIDKTPAERKLIIERAIDLAERRQAFNMDRANELRGGTYYTPGGGYQPNAKGNRTSSGIEWSIEP